MTITADNDTKAYGTLKTFSGTAFSQIGLVNGDTIAGVTQTSPGAVVTANVGTYSIVVSAATGIGLGNYTISYVDATLTVDEKAISFTIGNATQDYGSTADLAAVLGMTFLTGVNGENLGITYSSTGNTNTAAVAIADNERPDYLPARLDLADRRFGKTAPGRLFGGTALDQPLIGLASIGRDFLNGLVPAVAFEMPVPIPGMLFDLGRHFQKCACQAGGENAGEESDGEQKV